MIDLGRNREKTPANYRVYKILIGLFCFINFVGINPAYTQDIHFSTFDANPIHLNPAQTGLIDNSFRAGTIYRNQWSSVSTGYNTYMLTIEAQPLYNRDRKQGIGIGLGIVSDVAGSLSYGHRGLNLSLAYHKSLSSKKESILSIGVIGNYSNWGGNYDKAVFGKDAESFEGILLNNINTLDYGIGMNWRTRTNETHSFELGLSGTHLNRPRLSYYEDSDIRMPIRLNAYMLNHIYLNDFIALRPALVFQKQNQYYELIVGSDLVWDLSQTFFEINTVGIGLYYRGLDALITKIKYQYNNLSIGLSYDVNLSRLTPASRTYGGVELWILYEFNTLRLKQKASSIPCPKF